MLVVTTENVPGYRVKEVKGQVFGVVVRSRGLSLRLLGDWPDDERDRRVWHGRRA